MGLKGPSAKRQPFYLDPNVGKKIREDRVVV